ncbi:MAG TPA: DinB family protein [bacterium]|nr:DinB family protein [bacterium]
MTVREARRHFAFNEWANARYVEVLAQIAPAALAAERISSFPSLLATFAHLVGAEWIWLRRWLGDSPSAVPDWFRDPSFEDLRTRLDDLEKERASFVAGLADDDLGRNVDYAMMSGTPRSNPLDVLFLHVVNHSTFHRGQLGTLLRQAEAVPPATDFVMYVREQSGG